MFYYIIFLFLVVCSTLEFAFPKKENKLFLYTLITLFFMVISGLRWNTGNDWIPYYSIVMEINSDIDLLRSGFEPGWITFVYCVVFVFGHSFTAYLICFAIVNLSIKSIFLYRNTGAILLALLLFWATQSLAEITAVRQSFATAFCLIALYFITKRQTFWFLIFVILAMQFHASSFIFFFAYPVYYAKWSPKLKMTLLFICIALAAMGSANMFFNFVLHVIPDLGYLTQKAETYEKLGSGKTYAAGVGKGATLIIGVTKRLMVVPVILYYEATLFKDDKKFKAFSNLFVFGNLVYFIIGDFLTLQRLAAYFYIFEVILLCMIFEKSKKKIVWFIILVVYSSAKLYFTMKSAPTSNGQNLLDPYIWIFSEDTYRRMF